MSSDEEREQRDQKRRMDWESQHSEVDYNSRKYRVEQLKRARRDAKRARKRTA